MRFMAERDLQIFLNKVHQLQKMVASLEDDYERRDSLAACENHEQVVLLAKSWGYEIGRRWGEGFINSNLDDLGNLLDVQVPCHGHENKYLLQQGGNWRLELIVSCAFKNEDEFWFDQKEHEWLLLIRGEANLSIETLENRIDLKVGDHLYLSPHKLHRINRTDGFPGTIWLTLSWY